MVIPFGGEFGSSSSIAALVQAARAGKLGFKSAAYYLKKVLKARCAFSYFQKLLLQAGRRPVFQLHAQGQAARSKDFLDFVERLAAQVRRFQQFVLAALDQVADVVNVFGFQAVRGTDGQL